MLRFVQDSLAADVHHISPNAISATENLAPDEILQGRPSSVVSYMLNDPYVYRQRPQAQMMQTILEWPDQVSWHWRKLPICLGLLAFLLDLQWIHVYCRGQIYISRETNRGNSSNVNPKVIGVIKVLPWDINTLLVNFYCRFSLDVQYYYMTNTHTLLSFIKKWLQYIVHVFKKFIWIIHRLWYK